MILLLCAITMGTAYAQNQPVDMRVEVTETEFDDDEYTIFTYKDSEADDSFGYYLSLGRVTKFLGADEILNMDFTKALGALLGLHTIGRNSQPVYTQRMPVYSQAPVAQTPIQPEPEIVERSRGFGR